MRPLELRELICAHETAARPRMQTRRATICFWSDSLEEKVDFTLWLNAWKKSINSLSPDYGCGCCIHVFNVEGPTAAIDAIPENLLAASKWAESLNKLPW